MKLKLQMILQNERRYRASDLATRHRRFNGIICSQQFVRSRVAQWKRAGPITQRSEDQNLALLVLSFWPIPRFKGCFTAYCHLFCIKQISFVQDHLVKLGFWRNILFHFSFSILMKLKLHMIFAKYEALSCFRSCYPYPRFKDIMYSDLIGAKYSKHILCAKTKIVNGPS